MTVCTIDVHARDVVAKLISQEGKLQRFHVSLLSLKGVFLSKIFPESNFFKQGIFISSMKYCTYWMDFRLTNILSLK